MKRCFGYVRVSTTKQGDGVSLDAQKDAIVTFAKRNGIAICQWFEEQQTAAKRGRPVFNAMLRKLRAGGAAGVVMHKIDRSARNFADWAKIAELSDRGIDVHFATETLDFRSRGGRLAADIQAVIAADYIRNLREETLKGIIGRLKQGFFPFNAPIGYLDNGGGELKTPDPMRAPLIAELFQLYASGQYPLRALVHEIQARGLRNRNGNPISKHGIETILSNPFYAGVIRIKTTGAVYQGAHQPLISANLFTHVQEIKAGRCGKKVTRHNHTYRGLFRCGACGGPIIAEKQRGHVYYRCQQRACPTKTVREECIEGTTVDLLRSHQLSDDDVVIIQQHLERWLCDRQQQDSRKQAVDLQLLRVTQRLERLTDALIDQLIDQETFNSRKESLLLEKARLEQARVRFADIRAELRETTRFLEHAKSLAANYISAEPSEKREFIAWATSNRTVIGKNVYLEPANWLRTVAILAAVPMGDPSRPKHRSGHNIPDQYAEIEQLIAEVRTIHRSREIAELYR